MKTSMKKDEIESERTSMKIRIYPTWPLALRVDAKGAGIEKESSMRSTMLRPIEHESTWRALHFGSVSLKKTKFCSAWAALLRRA